MDLEVKLLIVGLLWFAFVSTNINPALGFTYVGFTSIALFMYLFDKNRQLPLERRTNNRIEAFAIGAFAWLIFIGVSVYLAGFLQKINIGALLKLLGGATPALAQSKILNVITFGVFIAFTETQLWARLYDFFANKVRIGKTELTNFIAWAFILAFSFVFLMFHVTSKGITNNASLLTVFLMMIASYILMFIYRETKQAVFLHIIANVIASYYLFFT